jgi:hypothetical protein
MTRLAMAFLRASLAATALETTLSVTLFVFAVASMASQSLGKQEPP